MKSFKTIYKEVYSSGAGRHWENLMLELLEAWSNELDERFPVTQKPQDE